MEVSDNHESPSAPPIVYLPIDFTTDTGLPWTVLKNDIGPSLLRTPAAPKISHLICPFDWSPARKGYMTTIGCISAIFSSVSASSYAPGVGQIASEWGVSTTASLTGLTSFTIGFAIAPMALAPLSEISGRKPIFVSTGVIYVISILGSGLMHTFSGMVASRFFAGVGSSSFSTMVGGLIADMYRDDDRNTPMALFAGSAIFGLGFGSLLGGFIAQYTTWRWIFYFQVMTNGLLVLLIATTFLESRQEIILSRKAKLLNDWYEARENAGIFEQYITTSMARGLDTSPQRIRWKGNADQAKDGFPRLLAASIGRPFQLLFTEPVVFVFSLWGAFAWSVTYICLSVVPSIFQETYGMSLSQANATFASPCVGVIIATALGIFQVKIANRYNKLPPTPEARLYFSCFWGMLMPIGLFMFGWTCTSQIHWVVPTIAMGISMVGIYAIFLAVFNYLADTYGPYASSAIAVQSFCRNVMAGCFPLVTRQMYHGLTYGGASSLLGGIAVFLTLIPWVLVFRGQEIRQKSKFATEIKP